MAEFVATAVANAVLAIGGSAGTALTIAGFVADYGLIIGGMALSASQAKRAKRKARDQYNAQQVDRLTNSASTVAPRELVLGRVRKGGSVFFDASTGNLHTTFVRCIALAGHEIDALEQLWFNDTPVSLDGSGNVTTAPWALTSTVSAADVGTGSPQTLLGVPLPGTLKVYVGTPGPEGDLRVVDATGSAVTGTGTSITTAEANCTITYQYTATTYNANVQLIQGTDTQAADAELQALFPGKWTSAHRARGVSYLKCKFTYNETSYPSGIPVVTATVRGAKVYDPRQNLLKYSEDLRNTAEVGSSRPWSQFVDADTEVVLASVTNPIGGSSASKIRCLTTASAQRQASQSISVADNATVTYSVYAKAAEVVTIGIVAVTKASTFPLAKFNVSTGTVVTTGGTGYLSSSIQDAGGGWYRCSMTFDVSSGGTTPTINLQINSAAGGNYSGAVNDGAYFWGAQAVVGSVPKAYCATTSSTISPTTAWSENTALLKRHVYSHASFGKATPTATEDDRFIVAANACDTSTAWVVSGVTTTAALYRAGLVVPYGTPARDVLDDLAQAMAGSWAFAGGELYLKAGTWSASVKSLTEADLAVVVRNGAGQQMQAIELTVHRERTAKFNTVNAQIYDQGQDHKLVALTPVTDSALVTRDGATLAQGVDMPAVSFAPQAQHVAGVMMRDARDPLTVTLPFKLTAYPVELFDTVDLTIARYGWSAKTFQVIGRSWAADGRLMLTLKESVASIFTVGAAFLPQGGAANTVLPPAWYVTPPGPLAITSGTDELVVLGDGTIATRMRVAWPAITDAAVLGDGGSVEVQYRSVVSTDVWSRVTVPGYLNQVVIADVQDANAYVVRARARTARAVSDWCSQVVHLVEGKSAPPSNVASLAINGDVLTWPPVSDIDCAGYQLRAIAGSVANWAGGFALHEGVITDPPYTLTSVRSGLYTYMVVAVDTSGNLSSTPASVTATGSYSLAGNTLESWPQAPLFAGTISGGAVSGGALLANASGALFWGGDSNLHWTSDAATYWGATSYVELIYTFAFGASAAGVLALDSVIAGQVVSIDMRRLPASPFWSSDAASFWTSDPAAFWAQASGDWVPWPGALAVAAGEYIEMRVTISAGAVQGNIGTLTPYLDVPTVEEFIDNAVVVSAGTRLTLRKTFRSIKSIQLTVQQDGGSAVTARWIDKTATGPLVQALDITGTPVQGTLDAYLKGY